MSKEETKQNIIDAFWELYQEKDIAKISVKQICERAGYHRTTFYDHFTDVYDVLYQLELRLLPPFEVVINQLIRVNESIELDYSVMVNYFFNALVHNKEYLSVIIGKRKDPYFQDRIKQIIRPIFLKYFKAKKYPPQYATYLFEYQFSALFGVVAHWFQNNEDISKDDLIKFIYAISDNGLLHMLEPRKTS